MNGATGEVEQRHQLVSTIRAATSNMVQEDHYHNTNNTHLTPPPPTIVQPIERQLVTQYPHRLKYLFKERQSSTNNSTISSVTVNGRHYLLCRLTVCSIRGYMGGMLYCNMPCTSETQEETGHFLRSFIAIVGLPTSLHSDNHKNLR